MTLFTKNEQVEVVALSSYEEKEEQFNEQVPDAYLMFHEGYFNSLRIEIIKFFLLNECLYHKYVCFHCMNVIWKEMIIIMFCFFWLNKRLSYLYLFVLCDLL